MTMPSYQALMLPLLEVVADGKSKPLQSVISEVADRSGISEEEREKRYASGNNRVFANRVGWARSYLNKAELLCIPERGKVQITSLGKQILGDKPTVINNAFLRQFESFRAFEKRSKKKSVEDTVSVNSTNVPEQDQQADPQERLQQAFDEIQTSLEDELLTEVRRKSPEDFEDMVVKLMQAMGYGGWSETSGQTTRYVRDGGVDGIINEDPLGLDVIYLQAKRNGESNSVGSKDIRAFIGAMPEKVSKGVFVTTSDYTADARKALENTSKTIILINGQKLAELMSQYNLGTRVVSTFQIKDIDADFFDQYTNTIDKH